MFKNKLQHLCLRRPVIQGVRYLRRPVYKVSINLLSMHWPVIQGVRK